jgi:polyphosphate kinase
MHVELVKLQQWVVATGAKVIVVFEGRDGAGKGGTIKALTERVSPRVFRVVALPAPTEREKSPRCTCSVTSSTSLQQAK